MFPVSIDGPRLRLREFHPDDAEAVWRITSDEHGVHLAAPGTFRSVEQARAWLTVMRESAERPARQEFRLAVDLLAKEELIGVARISVDAAYDGYGSIGYAFARDRWGSGYATEAAQMLLRFGFERLGLHRVDATIDPDNERSRRVADKLGMMLEGRMRERFRLEGGRWADALLYSVLAPEWQERATSPSH